MTDAAAMPGVGAEVITPGGPRAARRVREVGLGKVVRAPKGSTGRKRAPDDAFVLEYQATTFNWVTYASWLNPGPPIERFVTDWTVPSPPTTMSGQTIYLFSGLQDAERNMILQPVLQWSMAEDGSAAWAIGSWFVDRQGQASRSSLVVVQPGARLSGIMELYGHEPSGRPLYECRFEGAPATRLRVSAPAPLQLAVQTLESYGVAYCTDYPQSASTRMGGLSLRAQGVELDPTWSVTDRIRDCGQHTTVLQQGAGGAVELCYR